MVPSCSRVGRAPAAARSLRSEEDRLFRPRCGSEGGEAARHDPPTVAARRTTVARPRSAPWSTGRPPDRMVLRGPSGGRPGKGSGSRRAAVRRYSGTMPTFPPLHQDLTFLAPLSDERADRLVGFLTDARAGDRARRRLRLGRAAAPRPRGRPVRAPDSASTSTRSPWPGARASRPSAGSTDRATFEARDAREMSGPFDAVTCIGASQIWGPDVEEAQPLDYAAALTALRALLPRGGRLVYGEGIWSSPPTPAAIAPLSGRDDEYVALGRLVALAEEHGFGVMAAHEASLDEWDAFESGFAAGLGALAGRARAGRPRGRGGPRPRGASARGVPRGLPGRPRPRLPAPGGAVTVELERIDVADLDLATAARAGRDRQRRARADRTAAPPHGRDVPARVSRPRRRGPDAGLLARARLDGRLVGYAGLTLNLFENLDGAKILGAVHPDHQRHGIGPRPDGGGRGGHRPAEAAGPGLGRHRRRARGARGWATPSQGSHEVRRLSLHAPPSRRRSWPRPRRPPPTTTSSGSWARAPRSCWATCRCSARPSTTPRRTASSRPTRRSGSAAVERLARRAQQTPYTIVARHQRHRRAGRHHLRVRPRAAPGDRRPGGHLGARAASRHRLGLRMKLAMLDWLRDERPDVESVDTWNAAGQRPDDRDQRRARMHEGRRDDVVPQGALTGL